MQPNQLQGLINPDAGLPDKMPESTPSQVKSGGNGQKKELLQKLMTNLLGKPGRSMHEVINGVKEALTVYKNYAREWDALEGNDAAGPNAAGLKNVLQQMNPRPSMPNLPPDMGQMPPAQQPPMDGGGGPGYRPNQLPMQAKATPNLPPQAFGAMAPQQSDKQIPPSPQPARPPQMPEIAGQDQISDFNRPAPVSRLGIWGF